MKKTIYLTKERAIRAAQSDGIEYAIGSTDIDCSKVNYDRDCEDYNGAGEYDCLVSENALYIWLYDVTEEDIETYLGAMVQFGGDAAYIEYPLESAQLAQMVAGCVDNIITPDDIDEEEWQNYKDQLDLGDCQVSCIHWGVNGSAFSYCLASDWNY